MPTLMRYLSVIPVMLCLLMNAATASAAPGWIAAASFEHARWSHTATLLPNGKVLVAGGREGIGSTTSAELYDPENNTWTAAGVLATWHDHHTATLLPDGKVLVAGGGYNPYSKNAELYEPGTNTWRAAGRLVTPHAGHTATLLPNGKVLVAGGGGYPIASAELYDPATNAWTVAGALATARSNHTATLLPNGKVLVAGGYNGSDLASAELYDPATDTWAAAGALATGRSGHTATLLPNGKVLVAGGSNNLSSAELYDPAANAWMPAGALAIGRFSHTATLLHNGEVLVAGGAQVMLTAELVPPIPLASAELFYDPPTPVVEFYNTHLDHYFITADANEAAGIDGGSAGPGWARTSYTFKSGGNTSVCRFYGSLSPGPNSHFYTADPGECAYLKQLQASTPATEKRWNFESLDFVSTPPVNGACPSGTVLVYRAYNNGFSLGIDSNHRITSSHAAIQEVVSRGWSNEGVVMCAPN